MTNAGTRQTALWAEWSKQKAKLAQTKQSIMRTLEITTDAQFYTFLKFGRKDLSVAAKQAIAQAFGHPNYEKLFKDFEEPELGL